MNETLKGMEVIALSRQGFKSVYLIPMDLINFKIMVD